MVPTSKPSRLAVLVVAVAVLAGATSCGDSSKSSASTGPCADTKVTDKGAGKRPLVEPLAGGAVPRELVTKDLKPGTGAEAKAGDNVTVNYIGIACSTGKVFDASWDRNMPLDGQLVSPGLIDGWVQGVPGMKEGGRRMLVIPPSLAYGPAGQGNDIGPNETLLFVIDLVKTGAAAPGATAPASPTDPGATPATPADPGAPTATPDPPPTQAPADSGAGVPETTAPAQP